eukprot:3324456-Rhodomonas_salina.1
MHGSSFLQSVTEEGWIDNGPLMSTGLDLFLRKVEARQYEYGDHILAATDGSVRQSDGSMGAGCVFAPTNDCQHQG